MLKKIQWIKRKPSIFLKYYKLSSKADVFEYVFSIWIAHSESKLLAPWANKIMSTFFLSKMISVKYEINVIIFANRILGADDI